MALNPFAEHPKVNLLGGRPIIGNPANNQILRYNVLNDSFEYVLSSSSIPHAMITNTDITTDLNQVAFVTVPINGNVAFSSPDFVDSGNGIRATFTGVVEVSAILSLFSSISRVSLEVHIQVGFTVLPPYVTNFIGAVNGLDTDSIVFPSMLVAVNTNDLITIICKRHGTNSGLIRMDLVDSSYLLVKRM